jgi:hypothetical protein
VKSRVSRAAAILLAILAAGGHAVAAPERVMPVADFNAQVQAAHRQGEPWTERADAVALKFLGNNCDCHERSTREYQAPRPGRLTFVVIDSGVHDDSLEREMYRIVAMRSADGVWTIERADESWRCRGGRGHAEYSAMPCE